MAQMHQKILKGPGDKERLAVIQKTMTVFGDMMQGKEYDKKLMLEYYELMALDIKREKKRIGGDFAIAVVLLNKETRDHMR